MRKSCSARRMFTSKKALTRIADESTGTRRRHGYDTRSLPLSTGGRVAKNELRKQAVLESFPDEQGCTAIMVGRGLAFSRSFLR